MKKVLVGAMALLALAACSNEEVLDQNQVRNEIGFTAVTGKATSRAADGYCNNNKPDEFQVWANVPTNKVYFSGDEYELKDGVWQKKDGVVRYWPNSSITFFACKNATPTWETDNSTLKTDFTVNSTVANQVDFIYAVQNVASKPTDGKTELNFRHALSQVEFMAKNQNKNIRVEIIGVSVCNVLEKGHFVFPTCDTKENVVDHNNTTTVTPANQGEWSDQKDLQNYSVSFTAVPLVGKETATASSLTTENDASKEYSSNTMYLIPQTLTTWVPSDTPKPGDASNKKGYFLVKCKIWNVAEPSDSDPDGGFNSDTDVLIWPATDEYKDVAIPIPAGTWEQGKRYVYTFVFTTGGMGGYNPDPSDPTKPEDVLVPIKLDITVDDFVKGADTDVEMKK